MSLDAYANTFAGNPLDRASERRGDPGWIEARFAEPQTLVLPLLDGKPLLEAGPEPRLAYVDGRLGRELSGGAERRLFLGLWKDAAVFAVDLEGAADSLGELRAFGAFEELRPAATLLSAPEAGIAATAKAVFEWRRRHPHCSVCGQRTEAAEGGWKRVCPACRAEHFPRTDPVVIMLPVCGERCLLGRQSRFTPGMFSALAGFLEPGESIEEACAREVREEAGLSVLRATYHSSQPWPYPSSLMIGLIAEVAEGEARPDQTELEAVRWFTRDEARRLAAGESVDGCTAPPRLAIARRLIEAWAAA